MADTAVSNELPNAGERRADPFEFRVIPLDRDDDPLKFPYAPRGYEDTASPSWSERGAVGVEVDTLDWENSAPDEYSTTVRLQANIGEVATFTPSDLFTLLATLKEWATQPTRRTGSPTRVVVEKGAGTRSGVLTEVSVSVTEETPDGLPRTAELSISVQEQ